MDALSIAAVVGLVLAGKNFGADNDSPVIDKPTSSSSRPLLGVACPGVGSRNPRDHTLDSLETRNITPDIGRRIGSSIIPPKQEIPSLQVQNQVQLPFGQPVYTTLNRENVSNKMNNLAPQSRMQIGPGLGVGPTVPSAGGFQQYFRVLPNNPNDERLIQLKGNTGGPPNSVVKNGATMSGSLTQFPEKLYRRDPAQNSGQGQGGSLRGEEGRPEYIKTARPTVRAETGYRQDEDDIQYGQSSYFVKQPYADMSQGSTFKQLPRVTDNRSKPDRPGNGQQMNVRADPLDAGGIVTNLRREYETNEPGVPNGTRFQQYMQTEFYKFNEVKSHSNPWADNLSIGKDILKKNAYAISIN
jgi:hypothetical protein